MQNHRYYATINANNEKKIFSDSHSFVDYKRANYGNINCKGFDDKPTAENWLAMHDYTPYHTLQQAPDMNWVHTKPVFTHRINANPTSANIYATACRNRNNSIGAYAFIIKSENYTDQCIIADRATSCDPHRGVADTLECIIRAIRVAYDNGFRNVTVFTTCRHAANWINGTWKARCESALAYTAIMHNLKERGMQIHFELLKAQGEKPADQDAAWNVALKKLSMI